MSHVEEIAKQDSIRVKITWKTGSAKHEVEFDATAVEFHRGSNYGTDKTWQLTLIERPRSVNTEEITLTNPAVPPPTTPARTSEELYRHVLHPFIGGPQFSQELLAATHFSDYAIPFDPQTHYRDGHGIVRRREIRSNRDDRTPVP